jgi:hypothetical protein
MEIQKASRSELAPQEWKPREISKGNAHAIIAAQSAESLRTRDENDIKQVLRYAMVLVGLRGNNFPTDEEKFVLLNFVRNNFGNQTPEEIKIAFDYAVAGKLEVDAKCYESFSCEYFGRIMKAYIEFARLETKNVAKVIELPKPAPSAEEIKAMVIKSANMYIAEMIRCKEAKIEMNWIAGGLSYLYDYLVDFKIWDCPETVREEIRFRINPNWKQNPREKMFVASCKAEAYKRFISDLVEMGMSLNENGEIV